MISNIYFTAKFVSWTFYIYLSVKIFLEINNFNSGLTWVRTAYLIVTSRVLYPPYHGLMLGSAECSIRFGCVTRWSKLVQIVAPFCWPVVFIFGIFGLGEAGVFASLSHQHHLPLRCCVHLLPVDCAFFG